MKKIFLITSFIFIFFSTNTLFAIDEKPGRFFEDQPDVNDDHQIHFIYLLSKDAQDREWDINGKIENLVLFVNEKMIKATTNNRQNKKLGSPSKKYKYDYNKEGKVDITFMRVDKTSKDLKKGDGGPMGHFDEILFSKNFKNPKKNYFIFAELNNGQNQGDAGVGIGTVYLKGLSDGKLKLLTAHELIHTQGGVYNCVTGANNAHYTSDGSHMAQFGFQLNKNLYIHKIEGCPQLIDSVFLTPTSDDPYDPYEIACHYNLGKYTNKKFLKILKSKIKARDKKKGYKSQPRFGSDCRWRDYSRDDEGFFLVGSNVNQLDKLEILP